MAAGDAMASCAGQGAEVILSHEATLHEARNVGALRAATRWLIFLDADDTLAPGYVDALMAAKGDLRAPAVSWVTAHDATVPRCLDDRDIETMNPCVIGTAIERHRFLEVGGFGDWRAWEDWALFLRASRRGASIVHVPGAVYRATIRPGGRNQRVRNGAKLHAEIRAAA